MCTVNLLVVSDSLRPHGLSPARLLCPWSSPGKNTEMGCHFLLQGVFPTQGSNLGLLHAGGFFTVALLETISSLTVEHHSVFCLTQAPHSDEATHFGHG